MNYDKSRELSLSDLHYLYFEVDGGIAFRCHGTGNLVRYLDESTLEYDLAAKLRHVPEVVPTDAGAAWNAAIDAAAKEVASHWNHASTDVNQYQQAIHSAAAILNLKRDTFPSPQKATGE